MEAYRARRAEALGEKPGGKGADKNKTGKGKGGDTKGKGDDKKPKGKGKDAGKDVANLPGRQLILKLPEHPQQVEPRHTFRVKA